MPSSPLSEYDRLILSEPLLRRYLPLDESAGTVARDLSSAGQNGTYTGTLTQGAPGLLRSSLDPAVSFAGGTVTCPDTGLPSGSGKLSIEMIVKVPATLANAYNICLTYGQQSSNNDLWFYFDNTGHLSWVDYSVNGVKPGIAYPAGSVLHLIGTFDGSTNIAQLVVNGVSQGSYTFTDGINVLLNGTFVVNNAPSNNDAFNGTVAKVAIYAGVLTLSDAQRHYQTMLRSGVLPLVTPSPHTWPILAVNTAGGGGGGIVSGGGTLAGNGLLSAPSQVVEPSAPMAGNGLLSAPAQLVAAATLAGNGVLSAPAQIVSDSDPLAGNGMLSAPAQIVAPAALQGNGVLTESAAQLVSAGGGALAGQGMLAESGAIIIAQGDVLQGNGLISASLIAGGGTLGGSGGLSATAQIVEPSVSLGGNSRLIMSAATLLSPAVLAGNGAATLTTAILVTDGAPLVGSGVLVGTGGLKSLVPYRSPVGVTSLRSTEPTGVTSLRNAGPVGSTVHE